MFDTEVWSSKTFFRIMTLTPWWTRRGEARQGEAQQTLRVTQHRKTCLHYIKTCEPCNISLAMPTRFCEVFLSTPPRRTAHLRLPETSGLSIHQTARKWELTPREPRCETEPEWLWGGEMCHLWALWITGMHLASTWTNNESASGILISNQWRGRRTAARTLSAKGLGPGGWMTQGCRMFKTGMFSYYYYLKIEVCY